MTGDFFKTNNRKEIWNRSLLTDADLSLLSPLSLEIERLLLTLTSAQRESGLHASSSSLTQFTSEVTGLL